MLIIVLPGWNLHYPECSLHPPITNHSPDLTVIAGLTQDPDYNLSLENSLPRLINPEHDN